jgi:hypothetical protein
MPKEQHTPPANEGTQAASNVAFSVGRHVMGALGTPGDLQRLDVRPLWGGRFRVNVVLGDSPQRVRIAHSYFIVVDGNGAVVEATPRIIRLY